jgi:hypothetical protein
MLAGPYGKHCLPAPMQDWRSIAELAANIRINATALERPVKLVTFSG